MIASPSSKTATPPPPRRTGEKWSGRLVLANGSTYEGGLLQLTAEPTAPVKHGFGRFVDADKHKTYEGHYHHDQKQGEGTTTYNNATKTHTGQYHHNLRHGPGSIVYWATGMTYEGEFRSGEFHGQGSLHSTHRPLELYMRGTFRRGRFVRGAKRGEDGSIYTGPVAKHDGESAQGYGTTDYSNGNRHEGFYVANLAQGRGEMFFADTGQVWQGEFVRGARDVTRPHLVVVNRSRRSVVFVSEGTGFGRMDGDDEEEEEDEALPDELRLVHCMGDFSLKETRRLLLRGTYCTQGTRVTAQQFDAGPSVRDGAYAAWHDAASGNVRFTTLGPQRRGPIGTALYAYGTARRRRIDEEEEEEELARLEVYEQEGVISSTSRV